MRTWIGVTMALAMAGSGAWANDLLGRGKAVAPRRVNACEAFGPGFAKLDGSETCVKVSGQVRVETDIVSRGDGLRPTPSR